MRKASRKKSIPRRVRRALVPMPVPTSAISGDALIGRAVAFINARVAETIDTGARGLLEIGQYVFKHFFHGELDEVRVRGRMKEASFRALSHHPDLQISSTGLYNAVHLAVQEHQLQAACVPTSEHILVSHKIELLRVPTMEDKKRLLAEVAKTRLSVRGLRASVDGMLSQHGRSIATMEVGMIADTTAIPPSIRKLSALNVERLIGSTRFRTLKAPEKAACLAVLRQVEERIGGLIKAIEAA